MNNYSSFTFPQAERNSSAKSLEGPRITQLMMFIRQKLLKRQYTENVTDILSLCVKLIYFRFIEALDSKEILIR